MKAFLLVLVIVLAGCANGAAGPPAAAPAAVTTGGRCGATVRARPFQRPDATHILVANFFTRRVEAPDFAETVSEQVNGALRRFQEEELRDPRHFDIEVPEGSIELRRLDCFVDGHEEARTLAKELGADLVIWGKAFCNPTSNVRVQSEIHTGNVSAGDQGVINIGTVQAGKPYTVCPSATLYRSEGDFRRSTGHNLELNSLADLDLPVLQSSEPFQLVEFTLGLHFFEQENWWLAARFFRRSAEQVLAGERNVEVLEMYLGRAYFALPDLAQSLIYSRRALARVQGTGSRYEGMLWNNIGSVLQAQGDFAGALEQYRRALSIDEKALGKDHPAVAARVNNIGSVLQAQGDFAGALEQYRRALSIDEKALGKDHPAVATPVNNIGSVLQDQGDFTGALEQYRRALSIDEEALGKDHPDVATRVHNIGRVLQAQGDFTGALEQYRRALSIDEKALGKDHPHVATHVNDIGRVLEAQGDFAGALEQYRRALSIDEKALGKDHPHVATCVNNIGNVLEAQGDFAGALEQYRMALSVDEKALGKDHTNVARDVHNIGSVLQDQGDFAGALEQYRRALSINEKALGKDHPDVALTVNNIGSLLEAQGDFTGALEHLRRALAILEDKLGKDHPTTRNVRRNWAGTLAEVSGWTPWKKPNGAVVVRCLRESCAGLTSGDWIVSYGVTTIREGSHLRELAHATPEARPVRLTVMRDRKKLQLETHGGPLGIEIL